MPGNPCRCRISHRTNLIHSPPHNRHDHFMSRLNATAYEFVPGKAFGFTPPPPPQEQLPPPVERPEVTEAPKPPPTISLNIGGSRPSPAQSPAPPAPEPVKPKAPTPAAATPAKAKIVDASAPSKTFSLEKAKTDTHAIAQEVQSVADRAILDDLYGKCKPSYILCSAI